MAIIHLDVATRLDERSSRAGADRLVREYAEAGKKAGEAFSKAAGQATPRTMGAKAGADIGQEFTKAIEQATTKASSGMLNRFNAAFNQIGRHGKIDLVAALNERAVTTSANRLKSQLARAGQVSGDAFNKALEAESKRANIPTDKLRAALTNQFSRHGQSAGHSFGSGFGGQMARSLPGISGFASTMSGYEGAAAKSGALAGRALGMAFTTAAGGLLGAAAYTLFKGFQRYETIDAATHRLQNLSKTMEATGQSGLDIAAIMKTVNDVVLGTPIGLDKAMGAVTVALGSGIKQGDELKRYLTDIADAAGYSGRSFEEIALVFGQVQAKGRLMGEEVLQLAEKNIPAAKWLQETFKLTGDEYERMQEKGQISLKALQMAIEQHAAGQAKAMGQTVQGAISEVQSSISRTGANLLGAIFGKPTDQNNTMVEALKSIKDRLDEIGAWITAHQGEIHDFFQNSAEAARDVAKAAGEIGKVLADHKELIKAIVEGFVIWKGLKFTGLFSGLDAISNKLGRRGGGGIIGQLGVALLMFGELNRLNNGQRGPSDGPNFGSQGALAGGGAMLGWQVGGPWGAGAGALLGAAAAPIQDYANPPGPSQTGALPGAPGIGKREARTPQELYIYGPGFSVPNTPAPKPGGQQPAAQLPSMPPWTAPGGQTYTWDWNKGGYVPSGTAPAPDDSNPFLPPRDGKGGHGGQHLPKAPVVPYDQTLPSGFSNLPMSSGLLSAESSFLDNRHKLAEKRARLAQLEKDGAATEQDVLEARNDVAEALRDLQQAEMRLYEERASIFGKHTKQIKSWLSELGEIGASLDQDFGISKGLAGIAENITKFIANLAAAPILGQLGASQIAAGYKPGEAGQGAVGMLAASLPQYQIRGSAFGGGQGGQAGIYGAAYPAIMGPLPGLSVPPGTSVYPGAHTENTGGSLVPRAAAVKSMLQQMFPGLDIGGWRPPDKYGEHSSGEALDIMVGGNKALGDQINQFLLSHAAELGLQYDLWQQQTWKPGQAPTMMENRGSGTQNHMDHVHARFQPGPLTGGDGGGSWFPAAPGATGAGAAPGVAPSGFTTGPGGSLSVAPAGMGGPGGVPLAPGGGGSWWGGPAPGGPQPGGIGQGMPGLPNTSNPVRKSGVAPPQGKGSGGAALGGLAMGAINSAISAAGMAGDAAGGFGGGQAAAAVAQAMMQLVNRGIQFGSQAAGIGVQGLAETFLPAGSELANNNWLTKIAGGLAGASPMLPNLAGQGGGEGDPQPPLTADQAAQGPLAGMGGQDAKNVDRSVHINNQINAANANNPNQMANTVANQVAASYSRGA